MRGAVTFSLQSQLLGPRGMMPNLMACVAWSSSKSWVQPSRSSLWGMRETDWAYSDSSSQVLGSSGLQWPSCAVRVEVLRTTVHREESRTESYAETEIPWVRDSGLKKLPSFMAFWFLWFLVHDCVFHKTYLAWGKVRASLLSEAWKAPAKASCTWN